MMFPAIRRLACLVLLTLVTTLTGAAKPTLWIIGDSTVRNGTAGQQGWGDPLVDHFDPAKIAVVNQAIGGRSSRTFLTEGRWEAVMSHLQPGDYVLMQFGHNDGGQMFEGSRPRASIKGNGDESADGVVEATGKPETVRSFGWYLRKFAGEARRAGATPVVLSLIPRNIWHDGRIGRNAEDYALWAHQAADQAGAAFIDFNALLADAYEDIGPARTAALFAGTDHTHTNPDGAQFNAARLAEALRTLPGCDLREHLRPAGLWLPAVFSDHLVLQQGLPLPVWGTAPSGAEVSVRIAGHAVTTTADSRGRWRTALPALAAGGPHQLEIASSSDTRRIADVLVGEVWLCSGQSNMDFTVAPTEQRYFAGTSNWPEELAAADHPRIRMFTAEWTMHESPRPDVGGAWRVCAPDTAGDFSAVAYFFGRELHDALDTPVGLITCAYGASTAEAWTSRGKLAAHPQLKALLDTFHRKRIAFRDNPQAMDDYGRAMARWREDRARRQADGKSPARAPRNPDPVQDQHNPTVLFNGMIAPVIPYAIRGAIWYQGESNVGTRTLYPALQQALIEDWRERWGLGDFPFLFVQLANHKDPGNEPADSSLATMRAAQATSLALPNTGMAVTIDLGEARDIHPRNKQDVGRRLARLALAGTYAKPVVPSGPVLKSALVEDGAIRLRFDHVADGLVAHNGPLRHFAISGRDRKFTWADATIDGDSVVVRSPAVPDPAYVRYAWADNPVTANLRNSENLPAAPFRTDP